MTEHDFRKFLRGTGKGFMDFGIWFQVKKIYKKKIKKNSYTEKYKPRTLLRAEPIDHEKTQMLG